MAEQLAQQLGRFGVWRKSSQITTEFAAELDRLGYAVLWVGESPAGDLMLAEDLLAATSRLVVATSIVNVWQDAAAEVAASFARLQASFPDRFLLGIGAGHREATQQYERPYAKISAYVSELLAAGVPASRLVLAALGPKMLRLAAARTAGAIPYLVTPEYTRQARQIMGTGPLLAPEQKVVLDTNQDTARVTGRGGVAFPYLRLANYTGNLRRLGWSEADLRDGGSDALIDALAVHGSPGAVAAQLTAHLDAGADHVAIQLLAGPGPALLDGYRELAQALALPE